MGADLSGVVSIPGFHGGAGRVCALLLTFLSLQKGRRQNLRQSIKVWLRILPHSQRTFDQRSLMADEAIPATKPFHTLGDFFRFSLSMASQLAPCCRFFQMQMWRFAMGWLEELRFIPELPGPLIWHASNPDEAVRI